MNVLKEDDVPGAQLESVTIEDHSVTDLKGFLSCRNLSLLD